MAEVTNDELEGQMANIAYCVKCQESGNASWVRIDLTQGGAGIEIRSVLKCNREGHRWPLIMRGQEFFSISPDLPGAQSHRLDLKVPQGIKEDVEEAESTSVGMSYKASVVMCRRALQLALELVLQVEGQTLGPLLTQAKEQSVVDDRIFYLAQRVKDFGDGGAHRVGAIDPNTVAVVIHDTVEVLNFLSPRLSAKQ